MRPREGGRTGRKNQNFMTYQILYLSMYLHDAGIPVTDSLLSLPKACKQNFHKCVFAKEQSDQFQRLFQKQV